MVYFISGVALLGLFILAVRAFVGTDPRTLVRIIRYALGFILLVMGVVFAIAGRFGIALLFAALGVSAISTGRIGPIDLGGHGRSSGTGSTVRSHYLRMHLDHDSGTLTGEVLAGAFAGQRLDELDDAALMTFRGEAAADQESLSLLEAYLDRRMPGWREDVEADGAAGPGRTADAGSMTDQQAYEILGLAPGAGEAEIRAAHRRLMKMVHPDRGGSTFLAARINEAKDWLLGNHR